MDKPHNQANTQQQLKRFWGTKLIGYLLIVLMVAGACMVLEFASKKILIRKGLLPENNLGNEHVFAKQIDFFTIDRNTANFCYVGYDTAFKPQQVCTDAHGFITGSTAPLDTHKAENTIRIFLTGGSTMFGSLQSQHLVNDTTYPNGIYSYPASIAGILKDILSQAYPATNFEVINAAVVGHMFNQNMAMYFQQIHKFKPDVIINMDGFNDDALITDFRTGGDPYSNANVGIEEALNREMLARSASVSYTLMLLNSFFMQRNLSEKEFDPQVLKKQMSIDHIKRLAGKAMQQIPQNYALVKDSFAAIEPFMKQNMQKQLWLIEAYERQLAADGVYSVFCLQPMLSRQGLQKKLSPLESKMNNYLNAQSREYAVTMDALLLAARGYPPPVVAAIEKMGNARYFIVDYHMRYFINDFFSPAIAAVVRQHGGQYIDMNAAISGLPAHTEFYVDYCHLTPAGNKLVVEQLAQSLQAFLADKK